jgi:hypothetical protein
MCSLPDDDRNWAGRLLFTDTFVTDRASDISRVNERSAAKVTAVMVAVPDSRLIDTLYSRSSS